MITLEARSRSSACDRACESPAAALEHDIKRWWHSRHSDFLPSCFNTQTSGSGLFACCGNRARTEDPASMKSGKRLLSIGAHLAPELDLWRYSRSLVSAKSPAAVRLRQYLFSHALEIVEDNHVVIAKAERRHAGILVPLYEDEGGEVRVLLTERSADLSSHAGEVSFPGGKTDEGEDDLDAAVREGEGEGGSVPCFANLFFFFLISGGGNWSWAKQSGGAWLSAGNAVEEGADLLSLCRIGRL